MARRAFVGVGGNYIMLDTSKKPYILVQPENSGAIPAEDVRLIIGVLPNIDYSATLSQLRSRVHRLGEIQPSEVRKLRFDVDNWSVEELRKVKEGTRTLYVFRVLRYEEGFGGNRCPPSFCFRYDPRAPAGFKESCAAGEDDGRKYWDKKDCQ